MEEVLVDGGEFVRQRAVQLRDHVFRALHGGSLNV
jgi:hypothetical protein